MNLIEHNETKTRDLEFLNRKNNWYICKIEHMQFWIRASRTMTI